MAWNTKYWDIIDQLYWTPKYFGLGSIGRRIWRQEGDRIYIPENLAKKSRSLYTRIRNQSENLEWLQDKEEILNHVFDITFSIAPDQLIEKAFLKPVNLTDNGPFESLGREVRQRYGWHGSANVTQHDGLFVSDKSIVAVELKLSSSTWPEQILKYAALLAWEEMHSGQHDQLVLLFLIPEQAIAGHWEKCGLTDSSIDGTFIDRPWKRKLPDTLIRFMKDHKPVLRSVLERMTLGVSTWRDLRDDMATFQNSLDTSYPGDQCLERLIEGFLAQLSAHKGTGL